MRLVHGLAFTPTLPRSLLGKRLVLPWAGAESEVRGPPLAGASLSHPTLLLPGPHMLGGRGRGGGHTSRDPFMWDAAGKEQRFCCRFPGPGHVLRGRYGACYLQAGSCLKVWFCSKTQRFGQPALTSPPSDFRGD